MIGGARSFAIALGVTTSAIACARDGGRATMVTPANASVNTAPPAARAALAIHVRGNALVDGAGRVVRLRGVNRSGAEYACREGRSVFDGPVDDAALDAIAAWGANVVRLPLNEDCWLGLRGVDARFSGEAYRAAIADVARRLHARGMYVILDLHWTAPEPDRASAQRAMPDAEHAPDFWAGVAARFADDPAVLFDLFNEPFAGDWACLRDGCTLQELRGAPSWRAAGMQRLLDAVRGAGARQPVLVGGLAYANDLSAWLAWAPRDPLGQVVAAAHVYDFNACADRACWERTLGPVVARVPLIVSEIGQRAPGHAFVDTVTDWADERRVSYLAWTWNPWGTAKMGLIEDWSGTPTAYGAALRERLNR